MARRPLSELTRELTDVCMGRQPADLVVRGGRLVNVHTREVLDGADVAIAHGRVAMFGDVAHTVGPETETIDAERRLPRARPDRHPPPRRVGDGHRHTVRRGGAAARDDGGVHRQPRDGERLRPRGNALDARGGPGLPLKVFLAVPSCVPALPGFEDAGAELGPDEIREALGWDGVAGLGEMMNMPGVIDGDGASTPRSRPRSSAGSRSRGTGASPASATTGCRRTSPPASTPATRPPRARTRSRSSAPGCGCSSARARRSATSRRSPPC